jgi:hypothetical protein
MTLKELDRQDRCKHLLESPAPLVVGKLITELRKYVAFVDEIKTKKRGVLDEDDIDTLLDKYEI